MKEGAPSVGISAQVLGNTYGQLCKAVDALAVGPGDVRTRLFNVFTSYFQFPEEGAFPVELRADWAWIRKQMTRFDPPETLRHAFGALEWTMKRTKNATGARITERIVGVHARMTVIVMQHPELARIHCPHCWQESNGVPLAGATLAAAAAPGGEAHG